MDPKRAKLDQKSDFGHVRTYCSLNILRNIQRKIDGKCLGHNNMKYMRNIHKHSCYKLMRNKEHSAFGGTPIGGGRFAAAPLGLCSMFLIIVYHEYLWMFLIYSLYIPHIYIYIYTAVYICPKYFPSIFLCMFRNSFSEQI